ncbi:MAG: hypothetical protein A2749_00880 [Parcubacteria group bacterium RIFCSPHIGHO2_01_FULL_45_26]|nr:MAG: hypothetical protein A2749_00880 [Parcubacteria group bacterium RIFCSPHIGHO2_01_FULL_45_26]
MKWKLPHISKVYEALGAIADHRLELLSRRAAKLGVMEARVYSSSRNKFYDVAYDASKNALRPGSRQAIMSNDNSAYWKGELGYPAIALLMQLGVLPFDSKIAESLKSIAWKDINQKHKNDFDKTGLEVEGIAEAHGCPKEKLQKFSNEVLTKIEKLALVSLGPKQKPPAGY